MRSSIAGHDCDMPSYTMHCSDLAAMGLGRIFLRAVPIEHLGELILHPTDWVA
jgi:hypothetical protein